MDEFSNDVCVKGYGTETSCNCTRGYTGDSCDEDDPSELFCEEDYCANGGTALREGLKLIVAVFRYTGDSVQKIIQ